MGYNKHFLVFLEISILIIATFAFAYTIHESESVLNDGIIIETDGENIFSKIINFAINEADLIPSVSAQSDSDNLIPGNTLTPPSNDIELTGEPMMNCCALTNSGAICQDILSTEVSRICSSSSPISPTLCENDARCRVGCCIDDHFGTCSPMSTLGECHGDNVRFVADNPGDESCIDLQIPDNACVKGCCVLGDEAIFTTEQACRYMAGDRYNGDPFRSDIKTEYECLAQAETEEKGACVFTVEEEEGNRCRFISARQCVLDGGTSYQGKLCSNEELNTICEKTTDTTCVDGRDEIYFLDSCGNVGNIYDEARKDDPTYWNTVVSKVDTCGSESENGNAESNSCGNCNRFLGSRCGESSSGTLQCLNMNCPSSEQTGNRYRKNGESWCVYDGAIGEGRDTPGSRHWKRICIDGKVKIEPCQDYRGQICVQSEIESENGDEFSVSSCKLNEAIECLSYNSRDGVEDSDESRASGVSSMIQDCNSNEDCFVKTVDAADKFKFDMCVPKYPRGFDLAPDQRTLSQDLCSLASRTCIAVKVKEIHFRNGRPRIRWVWKANKACTEAGFADKMNDLCMSIGDCGASVNYVGDLSQSYSISRSPGLTSEYLNKISEYDEVIEGLYAKPKDINQILNATGTPLRDSDGNELDQNNKTLALLRQIGLYAGGIGTVASVIGFLGVGSSTAGAGAAASSPIYAMTFNPGLQAAGSPVPYSMTAINGATPATAVSAGGFMAAFSGIGTGATVGFFVAKIFGLEGQAAMAVVAGGMIAGGISGFIGANLFGGGAGFLAGGLGVALTALIWAVVVAVIVAVIMRIIGIGETKQIPVEFKCLAWQPPVGGDKCGECNVDSEMYPCSKYRCESLGTACRIVNDDTKDARCEEINANDHSPPFIKSGVVDEGYRFEDEVENEHVKVRRDDGACIPEFTNVEFTLTTDEVAQCKLSTVSGTQYEEMEFTDIDTTLYLFNHTLDIKMPSLSSLDVRDLEGDIRDRIGATKFYIKCQDIQGNINTRDYLVDFCVEEGPDLTPPRITSIYPQDGAQLNHNTQNVTLIVNLNEPAECKYELASVGNVPYDEMSFGLNCSEFVDEVSSLGYSCYTTLNGLTRGENSYFIKCRDQPWLDYEEYTPKPGESRNTNDGYSYTLNIVENLLQIEVVKPKGEIVSGYTPQILVDLELRTTGGGNNGVSSCAFSQSGVDTGMIEFFNTLASTHTQRGLQYLEGNHQLFFKCRDTAGEVAYANTTFSVRIDDEPPQVVRVLYRNGLEIITDEEAACSYTNNRCDFNLGDDTVNRMTNVFDTKHSAPWNSGITYFIKCKDVFGNINGDCAIKVYPEASYN